MIITKINKEITLLEGFTPKVYKGIIIESYFNWEEMSINSSIKEWDNENQEIINPTEEIPQLITMKNIPISFSNTTTSYSDINGNIIDTFKEWLKSVVNSYILSKVNPFTQQPYFQQSDIQIEVL